MTDVTEFLNVPVGRLGSGRIRYGAAMELWRAGQISAEVLEVYRVCSAHDGRNPMAVLRERGLPLPEIQMNTSPMMRLYAAAREYLTTLDHPGAAEIRVGLPTDPGPERAISSRKIDVVDQWLGPALALVAQSQPELSLAIAEAKDDLEWVTYDAYPRADIGESFAKGHAFASIMGEDSPFEATDFDLGLFLIAPDVLYRDHRHAAPELYAPLTGPHGWRFGVGRPLLVKEAHQPVWNTPNQPHLTKTGAVPFLCLFVWTRDVNEIAQVVPADDWPSLEVTKIV